VSLGKEQTLKYLILLLLIALTLFSLGLTNHGLWSADEPRVAEIGREMAISGDWVVPTLNQRPFLEEPPFYYGVLALTFKIFGVSDRVVAIPSALFGLAAVIATFFIGNLLFGPRVALLSALILATGGEYFRVAHTVIVDSALTLFIICTMGLFAAGYLTESTRRKLFYYVLSYVFAGLAFYTKGFIGIVIPGLAILSFLVADKNLKEFSRCGYGSGLLSFC
jgi:4-amino-4-deoxy-L-arabinose transferase-like glycosyltransferase